MGPCILLNVPKVGHPSTYIQEKCVMCIVQYLRFRQGFYNCLRQGFGITPKIWSFCTLEFTVHSALFLTICKQHREEILRSEEMEKRKRKCCVETCKTITNQTGSNKAECTVNSRVQKDQILGVIPNPCL